MGRIGQHRHHHLEGSLIAAALLRRKKSIALSLDKRYRKFQFQRLGTAEVTQHRLGRLRSLTHRQLSKGTLKQRHDGVSVQIAAEDKSHITRHIIAVKEAHHLAEPWILQTVSSTDDGIGIGRSGQGIALRSLSSLHQHVIGIHIFLFIDCFQLTLKQTEYGREEALGIELAPLRKILRRERVVENRLVERRVGVEPRTTETGDEILKLVGDRIISRADRQRVDVLLNNLPACGITRGGQQIVLM